MKETLDEFGLWVIDAINKDLYNETPRKKNRLLGFHWNIQYNEFVRNTHSAPVNGVHNFSCSPDKPIGYPGFSGRVTFRTEKDAFPSRFPTALVYTGTGGSGHIYPEWHEIWLLYHNNVDKIRKQKLPIPNVFSYGYEFKFYLMDNPHLEKVIQDERILFLLENENTGRKFQVNHSFVWVDEKTSKKDKILIDKYKNIL
jgi:hypothetical protein